MLLNTVKVIAVIILLSIGSLAQSVAQSGPLEMAVYPAKDPLKLWLVLVKPVTGKPARFALVDSQNRALYVQNFSRKEQRISQLFDLSEVADGAYTIRITTDTETVEKTFQLQTPALREQSFQRALVFTTDRAVIASGE